MDGGSRIAFARFGPASPCAASTYSFTMKPNGNDVQSLGFDCATNSEPSWSPNTLSIAAAATVSGTTDIFATPSFFIGKSIRLTDLADNDDDPAWSPNGKEVAFGHDEGNGGLYLVSPSSPQNETAIPHTASVNGAYPAWQPR